MRKLAKLILLAAVAVAATGTASLAQSSPAQAAATYSRLSNVNSGLVANVPSPWTTNGLQVEQQPYGVNTWNGQWEIVRIGVNTQAYEFRNRYSHQCLDVQNSSTANGAAVVQNPCDSTRSQRWILIQDPSLPVWHVMNFNSGLFLSVSGASTAAGADLIQETYSPTGTDQQWQTW